ncbi:hypothetical protein [Deinococcus frigens]|uniref:hypothetical protein n=1 Tax=Deinococcus frigens TaxID=249403 RepID=UPI000495179E|nr:hypothetical protein [Deinococcus frigens]
MIRVNSARGLIQNALLGAFAVGCAAAPATLNTLPLPPFAVEGKYNGSFESRVDLAMGSMRDHLRPLYGPVEVGDFAKLDVGKGWDDIEAFYAQPSVQKTLADAGFVRQAMTSSDPRRYRLAAWTRGRTFGQDEVLAVFYAPERAYDSPQGFVLRVHGPRQKP